MMRKSLVFRWLKPVKSCSCGRAGMISHFSQFPNKVGTNNQKQNHKSRKRIAKWFTGATMVP